MCTVAIKLVQSERIHVHVYIPTPTHARTHREHKSTSVRQYVIIFI